MGGEETGSIGEAPAMGPSIRGMGPSGLPLKKKLAVRKDPKRLKEEKGWGLDPEGLEKQIVKAKENGFVPRGIVVINPGNPTGQVMKRENLVEIIKICHRHSVLILADEVYQ